MTSESNKDLAWDALNEQYRILEHIEKESKFELRAEQIHALRAVYPDIKFEPRLLAHFDNRNQQPKLFKDNGISILPIERGSWVLGYFSPFMAIKKKPDEVETKTIKSCLSLETLEPEYLFNESMGLNFAHVHGVISDFCGQEVFPSVSGRHSGGSWTYKIQSKEKVIELNALNPQIEVDAGFEGDKSVVLIEAKNKLVEEFCLRQLYFPFRAWSDRVKKPVETIFAAISGSDIYLYEYKFPTAEFFHAELGRTCRYIVDDGKITADAIVELWKSSMVEPEPPNIPFPQANSPLRTIDIIETLSNAFMNGSGVVSKAEFTEKYGFDERQSDYYANTAAYFGFARRNTELSGCFISTPYGYDFARLSRKDKCLKLCSAIFKKSVFHDAYEYYIQHETLPPCEYIEQLMHKAFPEMAQSTVHRRAQGARSWIQWVVNLTKS